MECSEIIAVLRAHETELRAAGVDALSVFGSMARGQSRDDSDIDVLVRLTEEAAAGGFRYFENLDAISHRLEALLGRSVDVVAEPVGNERLRRAIQEERAIAF